MADEQVTQGTVAVDNSVQETVPAAEALNQILESATGENKEQAPKTEEKPVEQSEEDKKFAAKFAALTRKEKAIREQEKRLNQRIKELEAKMAATQAPAKPEPQIEEPLDRRIKKDPFKTLDTLGLNYETLTQIALNGGKLPAELQLQLLKEEMDSKYASKLSEVEKRLEDRERKEQEERDAAIINSFKGEISSTIKGNAEQYELLNAEGAEGVDIVFSVIDEYHKETGKVLDVTEAVKLAEEELLEQAKKRIGLAKIKKLLGASEQKTQEEKPQQVQKKASVTLSNEASQVQPAVGRFLSDDESKKEAAKLLKFDA